MVQEDRVLMIIDDEVEILESVMECLEDLNYTLLPATNGTQALEKLQSNPNIMAVLSDINMPSMTGLELLKKVRDQSRVVPFLFLSGHSSKEIVLEARRLDAFSVLDKPYDEASLRQRVQLLMTLGQSIKELEPELTRLCEEKKVPADQVEEFKKNQRKQLSSGLVQNMRVKLAAPAKA